MSRNCVPCPDCYGTGEGEQVDVDRWKPCARCAGTGETRHCPDCEGGGVFVAHIDDDPAKPYETDCETCGGDGAMPYRPASHGFGAQRALLALMLLADRYPDPNPDFDL